MKHCSIAVILGGGGYNDMGLIRSCGEAGKDVVLITPPNIVMPLYKSKYVVKWMPMDMADEALLLEQLIKMASLFHGREISYFPASDAMALFLDKYWIELSKTGIVPHAAGNMSLLMDKMEMVRIAQNSGMNVPMSLKLDLRVQAKPKVQFPCIVKPLRSVAGEKGDISVCRTIFELDSALDIYLSKGFYDVIIQSLVEGYNQTEVAVTGVAGVDGTVSIYGLVNKKRIRGNGSTVYGCFTGDVSDDLKRLVTTFIHETGYVGIFDMEFLHNDTGFHFIECNFRNGAYGYAVTKAGFNMPQIFCISAYNNVYPSINVRTTKFMEERSDVLNVIDHTLPLHKWLMDLMKCNVFLWWNLKDPKPVLMHYWHKISSKFKRRK